MMFLLKYPRLPYKWWRTPTVYLFLASYRLLPGALNNYDWGGAGCYQKNVTALRSDKLICNEMGLFCMTAGRTYSEANVREAGPGNVDKRNHQPQHERESVQLTHQQNKTKKNPPSALRMDGPDQLQKTTKTRTCASALRDLNASHSNQLPTQDMKYGCKADTQITENHWKETAMTMP